MPIGLLRRGTRATIARAVGRTPTSLDHSRLPPSRGRSYGSARLARRPAPVPLEPCPREERTCMRRSAGRCWAPAPPCAVGALVAGPRPPARAEMVYRMATMGEPKTPRPARRVGHLGELHRRRRLHGPADRRGGRQADPRRGRELDDQRRRPDLHLQAARPQMVGRHARHRRGLRLQLAAPARPGDGGRVRVDHVPGQERREDQLGRDQGPDAARRPRGRRQDARGDAREPDRLLPRAADPLHLLPGAQARHRQGRRGLGQARQHRQQRRLPHHRVDAERAHRGGARTPSSTTPPTSRSTR